MTSKVATRLWIPWPCNVLISLFSTHLRNRLHHQRLVPKRTSPKRIPPKSLTAGGGNQKRWNSLTAALVLIKKKQTKMKSVLDQIKDDFPRQTLKKQKTRSTNQELP